MPPTATITERTCIELLDRIPRRLLHLRRQSAVHGVVDFPASVTLVNSTVATSGGFFEAITNGACVNPLVFTIVDSAGKQTTAQLINQPGDRSTASASAVGRGRPASVVRTGCGGKTYSFIITGGTAPYNVSQVTNPTSRA